MNRIERDLNEVIAREICNSFDFLYSWGLKKKDCMGLGLDFETNELRFKESDDVRVRC